MAKEICISSTPHETRLAILEDDQLSEIYYERENEYTLAGSIYKGKVTRVLPGMQSAFVDIGLERDAFLYVTDFLEMEDPEDSDEVERATTTGTPIKSARTNERSNDRTNDRNQRGNRNDRNRNQQQVIAAPTPEVEEYVALPEETPSAAVVEEDSDDAERQGTRRWRGRRRRRGGRGQRTGEEGTSENTPKDSELSEQEPQEESFEQVSGNGDEHIEVLTEFEESLPVIEAASEDTAPLVARREEKERPSRRRSASAEVAPSAFVLPGESITKYGGKSAETSKATAKTEPVRAIGGAKPSTLIETPIVWDGVGLLPGESLARHRNTTEKPAAVFAETAITHVEEATEVNEYAIAASAEHVTETAEKTVEEAHDAHSEPVVGSVVEHEGHEPKPVTSEGTPETASDASASHHIDPLPPAEFRLFGFGGKRRSEQSNPAASGEESEEQKPRQKSSTAPAHVSSYAPGEGLLEEDTIEEEEYDLAPFTSHHDEQDHEELEEETLQIRSGDVGELLQEAHLDHRIQQELDADSPDAEELSPADAAYEEAFASDSNEPSEAVAQPGRRERNDRRGRRGRGERNSTPERTSGERSVERTSERSNERGNDRGNRRPSRRSAQTQDLPIISDLLKPGQEILVQIAKEPIAKKGARITSHIALPGRFLVFMPTVSHVGVSRKISSDEERQRLKRILISERGEASGGFIVRTAAEGATEEELRSDLRFLIHLWDEIKNRSDNSKSPALIYHDLSLIERILRDQVSDNFSHIWVDSEADYERILRFLHRFSPSLVRRVKLYTKQVPLFEHFGIQDEISKALKSKVWLKSGGSIVINQTEALVAIDINTGKYVGKTARLEDTILKTNLDAIPEIVRQIRLRDLGGIIVIDFIDMDERKNRARVMAALEEALKQDRAPTKVLQFNDFGLVAITRKRVKQSLERTLSVPCPVCSATGMVKSPTTVANEIYIEMRKMRRHFEQPEVLVRVNPETVKVLKANNARWIIDLEDLAGRNILIKSDATLHPEQFDIQG